MKTTAEKLVSAHHVLNGELARVLEVERKDFSFMEIEPEGFPEVIKIRFAPLPSVQERFNLPEDALEAYGAWLTDIQNVNSYSALSEEAHHFSMSKKDLENALNLFQYYRPAPSDTSTLSAPMPNAPEYVYYEEELYPYGIGQPLLTELHLQNEEHEEIAIVLTIGSAISSTQADWVMADSCSFMDAQMPYNLDKGLSAAYLAENILPNELYPDLGNSISTKPAIKVNQVANNSYHITMKIKDLIALLEAYVYSSTIEV